MKPYRQAILLLSLILGIEVQRTQSQTSVPPTSGDPGQSVTNSGLLAATGLSLNAWRSAAQDVNSTYWEQVQLATNPLTGDFALQTNHYTELGDNLNFRTPQGAWAPALDQILVDTNAGGAAALKGQTKVWFPPTIGSLRDDPITISSAGGTVLKVRPMALYFFDAQSGKRVLLASAQQSQGELVGQNQVVYKSIFQGCDIRMTFTRGAFESDLVLQARPKSPESYGLNSAYTRMELWHGVSGPTPTQIPTVLGNRPAAPSYDERGGRGRMAG